MFDKIIITVIFVCIPSWSYSDIYVCETEISSNVIAPTSLSPDNYSNKGATYFVVNSEKGVREVNGNKHTNQPCTMSGQFLVCISIFEGIGLNSFAIDTGSFTFTYVEQNFQVRVTSFYGHCLKGS